jgi:hypothetical protein
MEEELNKIIEHYKQKYGERIVSSELFTVRERFTNEQIGIFSIYTILNWNLGLTEKEKYILESCLLSLEEFSCIEIRSNVYIRNVVLKAKWIDHLYKDIHKIGGVEKSC